MVVMVIRLGGRQGEPARAKGAQAKRSQKNEKLEQTCPITAPHTAYIVHRREEKQKAAWFFNTEAQLRWS